MSRSTVPPDSHRCCFTKSDGSRCRSPRYADADTTLCGPHYFAASDRHKPPREPDPARVAAEILGPDQNLRTAEDVNTALTNVFRLVCQGRLSTRHAASLAYVAQLVLCSLNPMQKEAAAQPKHPILGDNPEAAITALARSFESMVTDAKSALANAVGPPPIPDPDPEPES